MLPSNRLGRPRMFGQERGACADLRSSRPHVSVLMVCYSHSPLLLSNWQYFSAALEVFSETVERRELVFGGLATSSRLEWSRSPGTQRRRTGKHVIVLGRSPGPRAWYFFYVTAGIFDPELSLSQLHPR
jgi:hypothetical protein